MSLLINFLSTRLKPVQFMLLAVLMSLLALTPATPMMEWVKGTLFLWLSYSCFRFLDDAGSVHLDRSEYPERKYAQTQNYTLFLIITGFVILIYAIVLYLIHWPLLTYILVLILLSAALYGIFSKNKYVLLVLPFLKYPVLLSTLVYNPENFQPHIIASFFIVLIYDMAEEIQARTLKRWILVASQLICGWLLFGNLPLRYALPVTVAPISLNLYYAYRYTEKPVQKDHAIGNKSFQFVPITLILYYPIVYFAITHLIKP